MAGYYDESDDFERGYAVAGILGNQQDLVHLDLAWRERILQKYDFEYFKASELNSGTGQFAKHRDNPNDQKALFSPREKKLFDEIKIATIDLMVSFDTLLSVGAVLVLPDYQRLAKEYEAIGKTLIAPYHFCAQTVLMESGFIVQQINAQRRPSDFGLLRPVFDSHREHSGRAKQAFDDFANKNALTAEFLLPPLYESDKDYLTLQAADNLAYECRRLLITQDFETHIPERMAMKRLKGRVYKIYKLNYEGLKSICEAQELDKIPFEANIHNKNRNQLLKELEDIEEAAHRKRSKSASSRLGP